MLPDSRRSLSMGMWVALASTARESWDTASTGTFSSRASSLREREM